MMKIKKKKLFYTRYLRLKMAWKLNLAGWCVIPAVLHSSSTDWAYQFGLYGNKLQEKKELVFVSADFFTILANHIPPFFFFDFVFALQLLCVTLMDLEQ